MSIWSPFNLIFEMFFFFYLQVVIIEVALLNSVSGDLVAMARLDNTVKEVTEQDI